MTDQYYIEERFIGQEPNDIQKRLVEWHPQSQLSERMFYDTLEDAKKLAEMLGRDSDYEYRVIHITREICE